MEHRSSWDDDSRSASQEIPGILRDPKVHYCVQEPITRNIYSVDTTVYCYTRPRSCKGVTSGIELKGDNTDWQ
jgi:hypothetical protein